MSLSWPEVSIDEVTTLNRTGFWGDGHPSTARPNLVKVVRNADVSRDGVLRGYAERYFSPKELQTAQIFPGDTVITTSGEVGKAWESKSEGYFASNFVRILRPDPSRIAPGFLCLALATDGVRSALELNTAGTTIQNLQKTFFSDARFPLPPLHEQRRIVEILGEAFEGIAFLRASTEEKLKATRRLFEAHLQSRFSNRESSWNERSLADVSLVFGRGRSRHRPRNDPKLYGGNYPFIQTGEVRNADHVITEYSQTYNEDGLAQSKLWPKGTVCITIAANIAETAILGFDACFPDSVIGVITDPTEADAEFLEYLLQSYRVRLQSLGKGSAQANINLATFECERFPFPPLPKQNEIVEELGRVSEAVKLLELRCRQKLAALEDLKRSLLNAAFTGKLR